VLNLSAKALPEEGAGDGILLLNETLSPAPAEAGCAQTGRMVLDLIDTCVPPPPKAAAANLPSSLIKVAVLGRPFAGKSLQAQRLAEASGLLVVMPMQLVEQASAPAKRKQSTAHTHTPQHHHHTTASLSHKPPLLPHPPSSRSHASPPPPPSLLPSRRSLR